MATKITSCPIWGPAYGAEGFFDDTTRTYHVSDSPRTGGGYIISQVELSAKLPHSDDAEKARLTTWLIDQRSQGVQQPIITRETLDYVKNQPGLLPNERAERLLRLVAGRSKTIGDSVLISHNTHEAFAWSETYQASELVYYLSYLNEMGWISGIGGGIPSEVVVSITGYNRISEKSRESDLAQAFVAMWFGQDMTEVYDQGIKPAIEEAGYNPMRIDRKLDVEKIDDAIVAEIRRSRFLVADFTHGQDGARGGVYFEAGFAMGLAIPVIFTCRSDMVTKLHFDTRQYAHIVWSTPDKLYFDLRDRILARIGPGPAFDKVAPLRERLPRKSLGQWLVDNVPRGTNLEIPDRNDSGREIPPLDLDEKSQ